MLPTQLEMFRPWHLTMNCENTPREEERSKAKPSRNSQKNTSAENFCARFQTAAVTRIRPTSSKNAPMRVYRNRTDVLQNYADFVSSNTGGANIARGRDTCRPIIRAAENLNVGCSTEIIDVNVLSRESTSSIAQNAYIEIVMDTTGRLYSTNKFATTCCWLKLITIAKDCCSYNVILTTDDKGVILKTVRNINRGEPLQMWFAWPIIEMLKIPSLMLENIRDNRYKCHKCTDTFEDPNPLKLHLALNCNRLDDGYIWTLLANGFAASSDSSNLFSLDSQTHAGTLQLLTTPTMALPINVPPSILTETTHAGVPLRKDSPTWNQLSPLSSTQPSSSPSFNRISPSRNQTSPLCLIQPSSSERLASTEDLAPCRSAFKPYQENVYSNLLTPYDLSMQLYMQPPKIPWHYMDPKEMEAIVSRTAKTKDGYVCYVCHKPYTRRYGLAIHFRTHTGHKPLTCEYCNRAFGDPSNLNKHRRLHTAATADSNAQYKCDLCGKVSVRRRDFERHMRSRHQQGEENVSEASSNDKEIDNVEEVDAKEIDDEEIDDEEIDDEEIDV